MPKTKTNRKSGLPSEAKLEAGPKMPRRIKELHKQIMAHPEYKTKLTSTTRFAFEGGCVGGGSWCDAENNKWSREIWKHLYANGPAP
jgi:hypothetical protein